MVFDIRGTLPGCVLDTFRDSNIDVDNKKIIAFKIGGSWCKVCKKLDKYLTTAEARHMMTGVVVEKLDVEIDKKALDCFEKSGYIDTSDMYLPSFVSFNMTGGYLGLFRDSSSFPALLKSVSDSASTSKHIDRLRLQARANPLDAEIIREMIEILLAIGRFNEVENECVAYVKATQEESQTMSIESQADLLVAQIKKYYTDHDMRGPLLKFNQKIAELYVCID